MNTPKFSVHGEPTTSSYRYSANTHIIPGGVGADPAADLDEEDDREEDGEGQGHAVGLLDRAAAPEEGDDEDEAAHGDQQDGRVEHLRAEKVEVLRVDALDHRAGDDQNQSCQL